jgi:hypothetical protein
MTSRILIHTSLPAEIEQIEGHWCATQKGLGLYAYGETAEEASSRLMEAVNFMVDTLMKYGGSDAVTQRLGKAGIPFEVGDEPHPQHGTLNLLLAFSKSLEPAE